MDPRAGFLTLIDSLAGRAARVLVATHDSTLAHAAVARLTAAGTPCELEQLFGMPVRERQVERPFGVAVRVYVPYGHSCLPYRRLHSRAQLVTSVLRDVVVGWR